MSFEHAHFLESVRTDPLFAMEGLDLASMSDSIILIERAARRLERIIAKGSFIRKAFFARYPLARYCVPVPFLRSCIESERIRREYMARPDEMKARQLIVSWQKTHRMLLKSIQRYARMHRFFDEFPQEDAADARMVDMMGNTFTRDDIQRQLDMLAKNAEHLGREIAARASGVMLERQPYADVPLPEVTTGALEKELEGIVSIEENVAFKTSTIVEKRGPIFCDVPHFDDAPTRHAFYWYLVQDAHTDRKRVHVILADRYVFLPLLNKSEAEFGRVGRAIFEPLIERNIPYWYQPATYFYTMRDQRYWADISTAVDLARRPHLNAQFVRDQRSSLLDLILASVARYTDLFTEITTVRYHLKPYTPAMLLKLMLFYSVPSIMYMPFNQSVWRIKEQPNFLGSGKKPIADMLYRPLDEVRAQVDDAMFGRIMEGGSIRRDAWKELGYI